MDEMKKNGDMDRFLAEAPESEVAGYIDRMAEACSASYSRAVYERAFAGGRDIPSALEELKREFPDFDYSLEGNRVEIRYSRCGCDLVRDGKASSPALCACSVASCLKNWETVLGKGSVSVELKESVLGGDGRCVLIVTITKRSRGLPARRT